VNGKDREQFREFMVSRWPELVRLGYALTGDRWLAEDLAQTALASACTAWWRVRRADDPDAYVRRILINASNRRFRRRRPAEEARRLLEAPLADPAAVAGQRSDLMAAAGPATEAARRYRAALLGGPERRPGGRAARVLGRHGAQPGVAGVGQAAGEPGAGGRGVPVTMRGGAR